MTNTDEIISGGPAAAEQDDPSDTESGHELRALRIAATHHRARLDKVLADTIAEFSRSYLQQLVEQGAVRINTRPATKVSMRVAAGDEVVVELRPTPQSRAFKPEPMPLAVVYQDAHMVVIDKPAGLVVHPAPGNWSGTLLNGLLAHDACHAELPRAGIVHRLDKDTSGLMLAARSRVAMDALVRMIAAREVKRRYLALAHGAWTGPASCDVDAAIGRDPANRLRMAVVDAQRHPGKPARTTVEHLCGDDTGCLLLCSLHTGRTHQIRVHLASIGHPLVADPTYGGAAAAGMVRQALHAFQLELPHPVGGQVMAFESPLPADMAAALAAWGLRYNARHRPGSR